MTRPALEDLVRMPAPDLWPDIEFRLEGSPVAPRRPGSGRDPRRTSRRALLIAATFSVLVLVGVFVARTFVPGSPNASIHGADGGASAAMGGRPTVTRAFTVPDYLAYPVAVGAGGIWGGAHVLHHGHDHGAIRRFDPRTGAVTAEIFLSSQPRAIAVAGDAVWVTVDRVPTSTNPWTWQPSLLRIDGSTGRVSGAWRLPDRGEAVAVGFGAVWVAGAHAVERFDLADMRTTTVTLDVPGDYSLTTVAVSDGSVWTGDCIDGVPSALFRVDPNGVNVTGTRRFGGCIVRLAPASSGLWLETLAQAAFARPFVRRLDATTLMDATRPTTFGPDLGITLLGEHAGTMWLYLNRGDARSSYLDRLDPTTGRPTSEPVPVHHPRGYWDASWPVYGEGAIWAMVQNTHQLAAIQMCATHLFFWHPCTALP